MDSARLHGLTGRINEAELVTATSGAILEANDRACTLYERSREELVCLKVHDLRPPGTLPDIEDQFRKAGREALRFETVHHRRDGTPFPVEVSTRFFTVGGVKYLHSLIRDLTEQHRHEADLRLLADLPRNMQDAVVLLDPEFRIVAYANAAEKLLGWTEADAVGLTPLERFSAEYPNGDREAHHARLRAAGPSRVRARVRRSERHR